MANISVATYTVTVSKKYSQTHEVLSNFEGADLFDFMLEFLGHRHSPLNDQQAKFVIQAQKPHTSGRQISGVLEIGDYGYASTLYDVEKKKSSYHRKTTESDLKPFFYLFDLPKGETTGLLAFERFKTFGIRNLFSSDFVKYFDQHYPNSSVHIKPIVHPKVLQQFTGAGGATKIRLRKYQIPSDICKALKNRVHPDDGYIDYQIVAKRGKTFDVIRDLFNPQKNELLALETPDGIPDKILVEITLNGKKRTLDVANPGKLRTNFDISDEVEIGDNGHPEFRSILEISKGILVDIWSMIKGVENAE